MGSTGPVGEAGPIGPQGNKGGKGSRGTTGKQPNCFLKFETYKGFCAKVKHEFKSMVEISLPELQFFLHL